MNTLTPLHLIFYFFAAIAICSAIVVVSARNAVRGALALVITFFATSGLWMILRAEFLSLILLLVYVGAVMTLFLFVVMMLNVEKEDKKSSFVRYLPFGLILIVVFTGLLIVAVGPNYFGLTQMPAPLPLPADFSNTEQLGNLLYTDYAYAFEIAGVMLLAALIAAITLVHRGPTKRKMQTVSAQVDINPKDRMRLVKMAPEPKQEG